ncbi:MAG: PAS domain S-box protein [Sphingobacteriaceae bacterium]|nr:MAG: PAS domain S-box protein [Sphingobacteriaceae bacterium]
MTVRSALIALVFLIAGLIWALFSDALISLYIDDIEKHFVLRILNDVGFFLIIAFVLYKMIRRQHNKLIVSEEQYRNLFTSNPTPMWIFEKDTLKFIEVNNAAVEKYGYTRDEFLQLTIKDIRPAKDHERLYQLTRVIKEGINLAGNWQHIKKSGEAIIVTITSHVITFNSKACKLVMATDITEIVEKEKQLEKAFDKEKALNEELEKKIKAVNRAREQSNRLEKVINRIQNLVLITNKDAVITWVNRAFTEFTGYSYKDVIGKRPADILFGPNTNLKIVNELISSLKNGDFCTAELANYKKSGEEYWTQISISPIYNSVGEFQFNIAVENIITERKEKEMELQAQHNVLKQVAWSNSHEVRRPVCSIISIVNLLKCSTNEEEKQQLIELLDKCAADLDGIVRNNNDKLSALAQNNK